MYDHSQPVSNKKPEPGLSDSKNIILKASRHSSLRMVAKNQSITILYKNDALKYRRSDMWSSNYTKCLVGRHVLSTFVYKETEYKYCVRCGKIGLNHHDSNVDYPASRSLHVTGEKME